MLTSEPTEDMLLEWKKTFDENRNVVVPNRKSGQEIDEYFREKYPYKPVASEKLKDIVYQNIMLNDFSREKLPCNTLPDIKTYMIGDVFVGIDLVSGFIHVECEDMNKAVPIYDDLFVFRGLDEKDIDNPFLVYEYIRLKSL